MVKLRTRRRKPSKELCDEWTGIPITKVLLCPFKKGKRVLGRGVLSKEHPSHARWRKKYKNWLGWIKAHPGEPCGRLIFLPKAREEK